MTERRLSPRVVAAVLTAFILGGVVAIVIDRATRDSTGTLRGTQTVAEAPVETLQQPSTGPVRVVANTVQFPAGYETTEIENGPVFAFVDFGRIQVESATKRAVYEAGAYFYLQQDTQYTLRVLDDLQLSIVRLLRAGVEPSTQVR
jgi:hypothetical protein